MRFLQFIAVLLAFTLVSGQADVTRQEGASGKDIVDAVVKQIQDSCVFPRDYQFLRRLATALSKDGTDATTYQAGVNGGIWKINQTLFDATKTSATLQTIWPNIKTAFNIDWANVQFSDLRKPLYSGIAGMLTLIQLTNGNLPKTPERQSTFYQDSLLGVKGTAFNFYQMAKQQGQDCGTTNLDLAFLVDSSVSVSPDNFVRAKQFASDVVAGFTVNPNNARVAFLTYSTGYKAQFDFQRYTTAADVQKAIKAVPQIAGETDTHLALRYANDVLFTPVSGSRASAVRIAVVLTDGNSDNRIEAQRNAQMLKDRGIIVFVIGVGSDLDASELVGLASQPYCTHVQLLNDYAELNSLVSEIKAVSCSAPIPLSYGFILNDCNKKQTFRIDTNGVTSVIVQPVSGFVNVYGSYSDLSLSSASPDFAVRATSTRPAVVYINDKNRPLYLTVSADTNQVGFCDSRYSIQVVAANALKKDTENVCITNNLVRRCNALDILMALYAVTKPNYLGFPSPCGINTPGYYPHPFSSTRFIYCDGLGGVYLVDCPTGNYYDDFVKDCVKGTPPTAAPATTPAPTPAITRAPANTPSTPTPNSNVTFIPFPQCSSENYGKGIHFFPYQPDDTKYIACAEYPGLGTIKNCSEYHKWNQYFQACVYKDIVINWETDQYQSSPRPTDYLCRSGEGSIFYHAHPTDPTKYIQCDEFGSAFVKKCRTNEIWSQALTTCVPGIASRG